MRFPGCACKGGWKSPPELRSPSLGWYPSAVTQDTVPGVPEGPLGPAPVWWGRGEGDGRGDRPWECWCTQGCGEHYSCLNNTTFDPRAMKCPYQVQSSLPFPYFYGWLFAMLSRGFALASLPGVERSLAVFPSGRCTPCLSYGSRCSATFLCTTFYTGICIQIYIQASLGRSGLHPLLRE